jgi:hypothetical protein
LHGAPVRVSRIHGQRSRGVVRGERKAALGILRKLEALAKSRYVSPFEFALIQFALGHTDLGFNWLTHQKTARQLL